MILTNFKLTHYHGNEWLAMPCHCGEDVCDGWAMIRDDAEAIADHLQFHGREPDEADTIRLAP